MTSAEPRTGYHGTVSHERRLDGIRLFEAAYAGGLTVAEHSHATIGISLVIAGRSREAYRHVQLECEPRYIKLQPSGLPHSNRYGPTGAHLFVVQIEPNVLEGLGHGKVASQPPGVHRHPEVELRMLRLRRAARVPGDETTLVVETLLHELLGVLLVEGGWPADGGAAWLPRIQDLLHEHFAEPVRLARLAAIAGVHPVHLAWAFRRRFGISVGEYLRGLRLAEASRRLADSGESLASVALSAGFANQSHLTRHFRRSLGTSPARYRGGFLRAG